MRAFVVLGLLVLVCVVRSKRIKHQAGYYPDQGFGGSSALASSSATATAGGGGYPQDYGMGQGFGSQGPDYGLQGQQGLAQQGLGQQGLGQQGLGQQGLGQQGLAGFGGAGGPRSCRSVGVQAGPAMDQWCMDNCNAPTPFCPPGECAC